jgi:hypothetical protein
MTSHSFHLLAPLLYFASWLRGTDARMSANMYELEMRFNHSSYLSSIVDGSKVSFTDDEHAYWAHWRDTFFERQRRPSNAVMYHLDSSRGDRATQPQDLCWMHIQKTSSWLGDLIHKAQCPQLASYRTNYVVKTYFYSWVKIVPEVLTFHNCTLLKCPSYRFGFHEPYPVKFRDTPPDQNIPLYDSMMATIFRDPLSRVISAFNFRREGLMIPNGMTLNDASRQRFRSDILNSDCPICAYALHRNIQSCQTKMVLGYRCGQTVKMTESKFKEAIRRVREGFAFIGLTEEYEASKLLFFAMLNLPPPPDLILDNVRNVEERDQGIRKHPSSELRRQLIEAKAIDPFDSAVYAEAQKVFYERCRQFGIATIHGHNYSGASPIAHL